MPKILRIHNRLVIGGPTLNVLNLTKYLQPDFETLLVVGEKEYHEQDAGPLAKDMGITPLVIPEMGRSIHPFKDYNTYRKLRKIINEFQPDIVHTHAAKPGAVGRMAAAIAKVPVIVHTYHGHVFHSYFGKVKTNVFLNIEKWMAKYSDALVAISAEQKRELSEQFKIAKPEKFKIVPLGFDLGKFSEDVEGKRKVFRKEFQLQDHEIAIGIIGRLVPVKNHNLFLEGIAYVLKNSSQSVKAFIIGDGDTRQSLESKANELGIPFTTAGDAFDSQKPLIFTSWRTDIDVINAGLDIICLTSLNEGTPVSLIEAQASGTPIVSTKVGGIKDIVIEGETALLSNINDTTGFCKNLLQLVEYPELREGMSNKGIKWVNERYSVQRLAIDFRSLYYQLLEQRKK
jgi:glycosyltransferase involved in cell wall biosynthesis